MPFAQDESLAIIANEARRKAPEPYLLGLMGGTFDPPHFGHIQAARAARNQLCLDAVLFIPACVPVYKLDQRVSSADDRLEMTRRAVEGERGFLVSSIEIDRGGKTYTSDTLRQLKEMLPDNVELVFIAGADAALTIPKWHESQVIARLARIAAVTRPGYEYCQSDQRFSALMDRFDVSIVQADTPDASSTNLRMHLSEGGADSGHVAQSVKDYAQGKNLY